MGKRDKQNTEELSPTFQKVLRHCNTAGRIGCIAVQFGQVYFKFAVGRPVDYYVIVGRFNGVQGLQDLREERTLAGICCPAAQHQAVPNQCEKTQILTLAPWTLIQNYLEEKKAGECSRQCWWSPPMKLVPVSSESAPRSSFSLYSK